MTPRPPVGVLLLFVALLGCGPAPEEVHDPSEPPGSVRLDVTLRNAPAGARLRVLQARRSVLVDPSSAPDGGPPGDDERASELPRLIAGATGWRVRRQDFAPGGGEVHAYVGPRFSLRMPPGTIELVLSRAGRTVRRRFQVHASGAVSIALPPAHPRRCADLHLHGFVTDPDQAEEVARVLEVEGLEGGGLVDWAGRVGENPRSHHWGGFAWDAAELGVVHARSVWLRRGQSWGRAERTCALHAFGHETPVAGLSKHSLPGIARGVRAEGGTVAGALGELDVAAALDGSVHASEVLVLGRFHHLERWYDLLSVGARVGAIAGADTQFGGAPQTLVDYHAPPGANRTCLTSAAAPGDAGFFTAVRAGRTMVTSGPELMLEVGEERGAAGPGQRVALRRPQTVRVRLGMRAEGSVGGSLELLAGGEVLYERPLPHGVVRVEETLEVPIERSTWLALRLRGEERLPGGEVALAHTSPVYVHLGGVPPYDREAAARLLEDVPTDDAIAQSGHATDEEKALAREVAVAARVRLSR